MSRSNPVPVIEAKRPRKEAPEDTRLKVPCTELAATMLKLAAQGLHVTDMDRTRDRRSSATHYHLSTAKVAYLRKFR